MTLIRYYTTPLASYGIDMDLFLALVFVGSLSPVTANVFVKIVAGIFAFILHNSFTFDSKKEAQPENRCMLFLAVGPERAPFCWRTWAVVAGHCSPGNCKSSVGYCYIDV